MKEHPKYPGYKFYKNGDIWSFRRYKVEGRKVKPQINAKGYLYVHLWSIINKKNKRVRVNRIICELWHGPPPTSKHHARHLNGIKTDNSPDNLRWGTPKENEQDQVRLGKRACGEKMGSAKLTVADVLEIRFIYPNMGLAALGRIFGVTGSAIKAIVKHRTWRHIP